MLRLLRRFGAAACAAALLLPVSPLKAEPIRFFGAGTAYPGVPLPNAAPPDYRLPPSAYGYPLDDQAGGYYGGGRYTQYYGYGRGYGLADFPGPAPAGLDRPLDRPWPATPIRPVPTRVFVAPPTPTQTVVGAGQNQPAFVLIHVPANAEVLLDGATTRQSGADRLFVTPPLTPNIAHIYQVDVRWPQGGQMVEQHRQILVKAGEKTDVTFLNGN